MAESDQDSKTELPSEKRLADAVDRGQFARSPELQVVFMLVAVLAAFSLTLGSLARDLGSLAVTIFGQLATIRLSLDTVPTQINEALLTVGKVLLPILGAVVVAALLGGGVQSGFQVASKALEPKFTALNPAAGFKRICSKATLVRSGVDLLKLVAIGFALYLGARGLLRDPLFSVPIEVAYLGDFLQRAAYTFLGRLLLAMSVVAAISYAYERFKTQRDLMMSRQEVKEERKQSEGDMLMKAAMRRMARRLGQRQMLSAVATADVVVTNPTHYAVALKYERGRDQAPVVLAKGENRFALRIKALAAEHGVPMVENKPVARMLFALGRVDEAIPAQLYQAVAEILAVVYRTHRYYFYRLKARRAEAEARTA